MQIVPVLDILNGIVVHAVRGQRKDYRPLQSILSNSNDPVEIALGFRKFGFMELYLADLDSIITCSSDFSIIKQIAKETDLELMVDAGITSLERARTLLNSGISKLIIGTETLTNVSFVKQAIETFGSRNVVISLDLMNRQLLVKLGMKNNPTPMSLLQEFKNLGVTQVIVIDLARVGSGEGVDVNFLKELTKEIDIDIYVGGGIRNIDDLIELKKLNLAGALIATAFHTGRITIDDLRIKSFL